MWAHLAATIAIALGVFVATVALIKVLKPVAGRLGWVDRPGGRKTHAAPTPIVGGVAILLGCAPWALATFELTPSVLSFALAGALIVGVGLLDDAIDLAWPWRFAAQAGAGLILVYVGGVRVEMLGALFGEEPHSLGVLSAPFTVLATVGIINAVNMSDGIDGLAGCLVACTIAMIIAVALYTGNTRLAFGLMLPLGAVGAFLAFNARFPGQPRARVFLGNAGSEFLGLVIAWSCFRLTQNLHHPVTPAIAPFLIAPPVIDCLVVMTRRLRNKRSPFSADRNHLHHILQDGGLATTTVVIVICAFSLLMGTVGALALLADAPPIWMVLGFGVLTTSYYLASARREKCVATVRALREVMERGFRGGPVSCAGGGGAVTGQSDAVSVSESPAAPGPANVSASLTGGEDQQERSRILVS